MSKKEMLHITKHTDNTKMHLMQSISTNCLCNKRCIKRAADPSTICAHCYAQTSEKRFSGLNKNTTENAEMLKDIIPVADLPQLNVVFFRFEAFGDLFCKNQVINYFNICRKNPYTHFALWTKNPDFIHAAIKDGHKKPDNLQIIFSGYFTDKVNKIPEKYSYFIDKIFNVWTKEEIARENGKCINCGSLKCINCLKCYVKNDIVEINEKLK